MHAVSQQRRCIASCCRFLLSIHLYYSHRPVLLYSRSSVLLRFSRLQTEDTRKTVRAELTANKVAFASLRQRLGLLISWTALSERAQQAVSLEPRLSREESGFLVAD